MQRVKAGFLDLESNTISDSERSGVSVHHDGTISLYGNTERFYQLSTILTVTKFNVFSFVYTHMNWDEVAGDAAICLYEHIQDSTSDSEFCPSSCFLPKEGQNTIYLGEIFMDRTVSLQFIRFMQTQGTSEIRNLNIFSSPEKDVIDTNDLCTDPNARRVRSMGSTGCLCMDGYISSNSGKLQGTYDTCLSCLPSSPFFDCAINYDLGFDHSKCALVSKVFGYFTVPTYYCFSIQDTCN